METSLVSDQTSAERVGQRRWGSVVGHRSGPGHDHRTPPAVHDRTAAWAQPTRDARRALEHRQAPTSSPRERDDRTGRHRVGAALPWAARCRVRDRHEKGSRTADRAHGGRTGAPGSATGRRHRDVVAPGPRESEAGSRYRVRSVCADVRRAGASHVACNCRRRTRRHLRVLTLKRLGAAIDAKRSVNRESATHRRWVAAVHQRGMHAMTAVDGRRVAEAPSPVLLR